MFVVALLLTVTTTSSGEVTESVLFHPIDQIHTGISSWILTTAIDFLPYHIAWIGYISTHIMSKFQ